MKGLEFEEMTNGSWYTIIGCGGDLNQWKECYQGLLKERGIGALDISKFKSFTGKDINDYYNLKGYKRFEEDLNFLAFPLDGLNVGALTMLKIRMGDKWFGDIVSNNSSSVIPAEKNGKIFIRLHSNQNCILKINPNARRNSRWK